MQETLKNLGKAFIGESQARNRYTMFAKQAMKDNYHTLEAIFLETADQEREHAKQLSKMINQLKAKMGENAPLHVEVTVPAEANFGTTFDNLKGAIEGETYENTTMYPEFAKVAKEEGLEDVARRLLAIGAAEKHHKERYQKILAAIENDTLLKKDKPVVWFCRKCGYMHIGNTPPGKCPSCDHEQEYFYLGNEEY